MKNFWLLFGLSQLSSVGAILQAQDTNTTGTDDVLGKMLVVGGKAGQAFIANKPNDVDSYLRQIRDSLTDYLDTKTTV